MNKALLVDRDDTLVFDIAIDPNPEKVTFKPGVIAGLKVLSEKGYKLICITNQGGPLFHGSSTPEKIEAVHQKMQELLQDKGLKFNGFYYCPHYPPTKCKCRKPEPGMILKAADEHNLNLSHSVMVGDRSSDIFAGKNAGCGLSVLIKGTPKQEKDFRKKNCFPDYSANNFADMVVFVLRNNGDTVR